MDFCIYLCLYCHGEIVAVVDPSKESYQLYIRFIFRNLSFVVDVINY